MPTTQLTAPTPVRPKFDNGREWLAALGDVPMERIIFDPWPGTATEADLLLLVERDGRLCELIDGTLVEKPMGAEEGVVAANIVYLLNRVVFDSDLGVVIGADTTLRMKISDRIRLPDAGFISSARWFGLPDPRPKVPRISPELVVEVLSESNTAAEMSQKLKEYFGSGTRLAWIVDPDDHAVAVYTRPDEPDRTLAAADQINGGDVLPGFTAVVADFFRKVRPPTR